MSELDGAALLDELRDVLTRYVVMPSDEATDAVCCWIAATHCQHCWEAATRLVIKSPEKRCGKSRLVDIIEAICHCPLLTVNISPAALVRSIGDDPPTILIDEADTVFGTRKAAEQHEDLRGIINAGHQRGRPYVRWDANTRGPEHCATFAMAALAGIGDMPDTIEDRAVIVSMRRRAPNETVKPFRRRNAPALHNLRDRLAEWCSDAEPQLVDAEPDMPVEDRAADTWEPLIAIADAAGGTWPARIRGACVVLTEEAEAAEVTLGARLLADLRDVFGESPSMHTDEIIGMLCKIDEAPWSDFYGREVNPRDIAKLLKPYGVKAVDVKISGINRRGYRRDALYEAWVRYLPDDDTPGTTSTTGATAQVKGHDQVAGSTSQVLPTTSAPVLTSGVAEVADVVDDPPVAGEADVIDLLRRQLGAHVIAGSET